MENKVIAKEYVDKNYIEIQLIEQKIWNDLENIYTLAEKDTAKQWDKEYYIMLGRYDLAKEIKDKIEEYKNMLKTCNKAKDIDRIKTLNERIMLCKELLGG